MSRLIVLDTETTGLSAVHGDRIIEIGCVELINRKLTGHNFHRYINPERDSHEDALRVHGISNEFLRDKPKFAEIVDDFLGYLQGTDRAEDVELIIHNAAFDEGFLNKELERLGHPPLRHWVRQVTDSLAMAKELFPGKRNSLDALCERLGVDNSGRTLHGALLDAELLADVYIYMTRGQHTLLADTLHPTGAYTAHTSTENDSIDLRQFTLTILPPSEAELQAHREVLQQIDKASGGRTLWLQDPIS